MVFICLLGVWTMKIDVWDLQKASFLQRAQVRMKVTHREQERCCYKLRDQ